MNSAKDGKQSSNRKDAVKLIGVAVVLGALALAADLAWMAPHRSTVTTSAVASQREEQKEVSPSSYFPSHFKLQTNEAEEQAPTF